MKQHIISAYEQAVEDLQSNGHYICFEYLGASVGFYSDELEAIMELSKRFAGYFSISLNPTPDAMVYGSQDTTLFDQFYTEIAGEISSNKDYTELPLDDTHSLIFDSEIRKMRRQEKICYILDRPQRVTLISYTGEKMNRRALSQRVIRNLIRLQLLEQGWVPLHGAALEKDGVGLCLIGGKFSGKTSTLINLLSYPDAKLVANTKFFIHDTGNGLEVCGLPHKAGIRVGTLLAHPLLQHWIDKPRKSIYEQLTVEELREIAATTTLEELKDRPEKISLMPLEMVELFKIDIVHTTKLQAFISVSFDHTLENAHLEPLEEEQALLTTAEHFRLPSFERQSFLRSFFTFTDEMVFEKLVELLTKYLPSIAVQELTQNAYTNAQSEALIHTLTDTILGQDSVITSPLAPAQQVTLPNTQPLHSEVTVPANIS